MRACIAAVLLFSTATCSSPTGPGASLPPSADDGVIVFHRKIRDVPVSEPWSIRADGTGFQRVDQPFRLVGGASVDTSGTRVAFNESGDVIVAFLRGAVPWLDVTYDRKRSHPLISPDGRYVASEWQGPDGAGFELRVTRTDRGGEHVVATSPAGVNPVRAVAWFPGSDSLLIRRHDAGPEPMYFVVDRNGWTMRELEVDGIHEMANIAISPTGRYLAGSGSGQIGEPASRTMWLFDRQRGERRTLVVMPHLAGRIAWSPNERFLAHIPGVSPETTIDLEIIEVQSGARWTLIDADDFITQPSWIKALP